MTFPRIRTRSFLVVSAVLVAAAVALAGWLAGTFFERRLLRYEEEHAATVVVNQARQHLTAQYFAEDSPVARRGFQDFMEGLPGVFRLKAFDPSGRIVWSNESRLIGQTFPDSPYLRAALAGRLTTVIERPRRAEHVFERDRGHIAEAYVPIVFTDGAGPSGIVETYRDVSEVMSDLVQARWTIWAVGAVLGAVLYTAIVLVVWQSSSGELRAMRQLERQNQELDALQRFSQSILSGIADSVVIIDREMRVAWMNDAAAVQLGSGAIGRACFDLAGASPEACDGCPAVRTLQTGGVERGVRSERSPSGRTMYFDLVTAPLRDASGRVDRVIEVSRDITDLVEMEERLKHTNRELLETQAQLVEKERLAAIGQVVVGLHHAILNPVTGALGALQVLREADRDRPERIEAVAAAEAEIRKIEALVRRLPDLRRADDTPYVGKTTMLDFERAWGPGAPPPSREPRP